MAMANAEMANDQIFMSLSYVDNRQAQVGQLQSNLGGKVIIRLV